MRREATPWLSTNNILWGGEALSSSFNVVERPGSVNRRSRGQVLRNPICSCNSGDAGPPIALSP